MSEQDVSLPPMLQDSLCIRCDHKRLVVSGKGSVFMMCQAKPPNANWPKYPPQPVRGCPQFCQDESTPASDAED